MPEYYEYKPVDYSNNPASLEDVIKLLAEAVYAATSSHPLEEARQRGAEALRAAHVYLQAKEAEKTRVSAAVYDAETGERTD